VGLHRSRAPIGHGANRARQSIGQRIRPLHHVWSEVGSKRLSSMGFCKSSIIQVIDLIEQATNKRCQSIMLSANHSAYVFNNFYPSIVRGFNLGSNTITLVCTAPPYLVGALITFAMAYNSDRLGERGWHIIVSMSVAITGFIISVAALNVPARYFASFLYIAGCFTGNSLVFAWGASTTSQTPEKRACATAIINVLGQAGNIW
jgi:hypothetical protein